MEITKSKGHTLICSDVFEGLNIVPDKSVDLIFIDPPYNIGKIFENTEDHWQNDNEYLEWCAINL